MDDCTNGRFYCINGEFYLLKGVKMGTWDILIYRIHLKNKKLIGDNRQFQNIWTALSFLLIEPMNHLDLDITALNNGMKASTGNMIFTSHDFQILDTVGNRIIEVTANGIIDQLMTYSEYIHSGKVKAMRLELYSEEAYA